ncbi:hypothetical protein SK128_028527 [Halocaridina rubra]|uniref:Neurotransmitter-gated ion-channel transmembrane domain-containing protein n=1 Tax=Halocaridina rubra TaxID=373956 RepID=A0AAN8XA56_HALRR
MKIPHFIEEQWDLDQDLKINKDKVRNFHDDHDMDVRVIKVDPHVTIESGEVFKDAFQRRQINALEGMLKIMNHQVGQQDRSHQVSRLVEEWKYVSRVVDRILFILFAITTFLFNVLILTESPFSEEFEYCPLGPGLCSDGYDFTQNKAPSAGGGGGGGH